MNKIKKSKGIPLVGGGAALCDGFGLQKDHKGDNELEFGGLVGGGSADSLAVAVAVASTEAATSTASSSSSSSLSPPPLLEVSPRTCFTCSSPPERLMFGWEVYCQKCAEIEDDEFAHEWRTYVKLCPFIQKLRLPPRRHRGEKECWECKAKDKDLVVLYDDVCDEWLFCNACRHFKQLLRVWNRVYDKLMDLLERPIILNDADTFETEVGLLIKQRFFTTCTDKLISLIHLIKLIYEFKKN